MQLQTDRDRGGERLIERDRERESNREEELIREIITKSKVYIYS